MNDYQTSCRTPMINQNELEFQHIKKSNNNLKNTIKRNSNLIILILTGVILLSTVMTTSSIICKLFTLIENSKLKKIDYLKLIVDQKNSSGVEQSANLNKRSISLKSILRAITNEKKKCPYGFVGDNCEIGNFKLNSFHSSSLLIKIKLRMWIIVCKNKS